MSGLILNAENRPFSDRDAAHLKALRMQKELGWPFVVVEHPEGGYAVKAQEEEAPPAQTDSEPSPDPEQIPAFDDPDEDIDRGWRPGESEIGTPPAWHTRAQSTPAENEATPAAEAMGWSPDLPPPRPTRKPVHPGEPEAERTPLPPLGGQPPETGGNGSSDLESASMTFETGEPVAEPVSEGQNVSEADNKAEKLQARGALFGLNKEETVDLSEEALLKDEWEKRFPTLRYRPTFRAFVPQYIAILLLLVLATDPQLVWGWFLTPEDVAYGPVYLRIVPRAIYWISILGAAWYSLKIIYVVYANLYTIGNREVRHRQGIFIHRHKDIATTDVRTINYVHDGVMGRILNYGTISLGTAGTAGIDVTLNRLHEPKKLIEEIKRRKKAALQFEGRLAAVPE